MVDQSLQKRRIQSGQGHAQSRPEAKANLLDKERQPVTIFSHLPLVHLLVDARLVSVVWRRCYGRDAQQSRRPPTTGHFRALTVSQTRRISGKKKATGSRQSSARSNHLRGLIQRMLKLLLCSAAGSRMICQQVSNRLERERLLALSTTTRRRGCTRRSRGDNDPLGRSDLQVKEKLVDVPLQQAQAKEIRVSFQQIAADRYDNWQPFSHFRAAHHLHFCPKYQVSIKGCTDGCRFPRVKSRNQQNLSPRPKISLGRENWQLALHSGLFWMTSMPQAIDGPFVRSLLDLKGQMRSQQDWPLRTNLTIKGKYQSRVSTSSLC